LFDDKISFDFSVPNSVLIKLSGDWKVSAGLIPLEMVTDQFKDHPQVDQISFAVAESIKWDSGLISFLLELIRRCEQRKIHVSLQGLPLGLQKMLTLALKVHERNISREKQHQTYLEQVGESTISFTKSFQSWMEIIGDITISLWRLIIGRAIFRHSDFIMLIKRCGVDALPLVSLISILVGVILAFVGAIQLQMYGAQVFIADIVGIAMVRVLSAVMTGIIMAGRIGASFAAELGIMQTNEEIDALRTLGVSPTEFLVLPRVLALFLMIPVLTLYADLMGILGGFMVSVFMLKLNPVEYLHHTQNAIKLKFLWVGLVHSVVFGLIIATAGCLRGLQCERNAAGVGIATTSAVVTGITGIVIATAIITYICQIIGI
jgi:phospholipid/cholesterol/gamma-HCH transport system permease protein